MFYVCCSLNSPYQYDIAIQYWIAYLKSVFTLDRLWTCDCTNKALFDQAVLVNTAETVRVRYFMDMLMAKGRPVMLVGTSGCGKTVMINNKLDSLNSDDYVVANVPFNFYTNSEMLQTVRTILKFFL